MKLLFIITLLTKKEKFMKKCSILGIIASLGLICAANAADISIYYSPTCPHCHHARDFFRNNLIYEFPSIKISEVNVTQSENQGVFMDTLKKCEYESGGVPVIVIGEKCFQGYADYMQTELRDAVAIDLTDTEKQFATDVQEKMKTDADKYRSENSNKVAKISEYVSESKKKVIQ